MGTYGSKHFWTHEALPVLLGEFVGTAMLLLLGCLVSYITEGFRAGFAWGLAVIGGLQVSMHISGGHINPSVSLTAAIVTNIKWRIFPFYIIGQLIGAVFGFFLIWILAPCKNKTHVTLAYYENYYKHGIDSNTTGYPCVNLPYCVTKPGIFMSDMRAFGVEFVLTSYFLLTLCTMWNKKNEMWTDATSLKAGFILMGCFLTAGPYTGGSINTFRSLAPALFFKDALDTTLWVYFAAPLLAAVVVGLLYWLFVIKIYGGEVVKQFPETAE